MKDKKLKILFGLLIVIALSAIVYAAGNLKVFDHLGNLAFHVDPSGNVNASGDLNVDQSGFFEENVTATYFIGNGSQLTDIYAPGDGNSNCSAPGSCSQVAYMDYYNSGDFNMTGNLTVGDEGEDKAHQFYINGTNVVSYSLLDYPFTWCNTTTCYDLDDFLGGGVDSGDGEYLDVVGSTMNFNETKLNETIDDRAFTDYEQVSATSASTSANKDQTVDCPAGKSVTGGGCYISSTNTNLAIHRSYPVDSDTWGCRGHETDGVGASWTLTAYAICANV